MKLEKIRNEVLGEEYWDVTLDSGLRVAMLPMRSFSGAYALFGTRYGSIDVSFRTGGDIDASSRAASPQSRIVGAGDVTVPAGIAHFLEHKLFESEQGDVFARYAETGAYANAFTSFDRTCYLFSCSGHFDESFDILLDFVQAPYFTQQTVAKEQGIIGQEIRMYDDSAPWRVFFGLLGALYQTHPVRVDIAGTVDSIAEIDAELLYSCYRTFYNPGNMFICLAGRIDPEAALERIVRALKPAEPFSAVRADIAEPPEIVQPLVKQKLAVSMPLFALGYKENCPTPNRTLEEKLEAEVLLEILSGNASPLYRELFDAELIGESFEAEYFTGRSYASAIFQGESKSPEKVAEAVARELTRRSREGIPAAEFESAKRKLYGRAIMRYNNVDSAADMLTQAVFDEYGVFDPLEVLQRMTAPQVSARMERLFTPDRAALSVIEPA